MGVQVLSGKNSKGRSMLYKGAVLKYSVSGFKYLNFLGKTFPQHSGT